MAKAIRTLHLEARYGREGYVALREDGAVFSRERGFNGYAVGYTKWQRVAGQQLAYWAKILNTPFPSGDECVWVDGICVSGDLGYRLPNG